jgi:carbamoyl-phosphate synthase large subunit
LRNTTPEDHHAEQLRRLKRLGLSDERIATEWKLEGHAGIQQVRELREGKGSSPSSSWWTPARPSSNR